MATKEETIKSLIENTKSLQSKRRRNILMLNLAEVSYEELKTNEYIANNVYVSEEYETYEEAQEAKREYEIYLEEKEMRE